MTHALVSRKTESRPSGSHNLPSSFKVSHPGDTFEQEADRVAGAVTSGEPVHGWSIANVGVGHLLRQTADGSGTQQTQQPKPNNYAEGGAKLAEAFMQTDTGKKILQAVTDDPLVKAGEAFLASLPGKIITGAAAAGTVAALAAEHKALPIQIPAIPLGKISPKLEGASVKITYEGPVDKPTQAMITFSYTPGGSKKKKESDTDRVRADAARIARDQDTFRAGMTYQPGTPEAAQQQADQKMFDDYALHRIGTPLPGTGGVPLGAGFGGPQQEPDTGLRLPTFESRFKPKTPTLLDQKLELNPMDAAPPISSDKDKKEETPVQRKADGNAAVLDPTALNAGLHSTSRPLDRETQRFMESRIGYDFSKVKIHTDEHAAASARAMGALAYTVGDSVVFGAGHYNPQSTEGRRLLAHELTHVVQQSRVPNRPAGIRPVPVQVQRQTKDEQDVDETFAGLYGALYSDVEHQSPPVLVDFANNLSQKYEEAQAKGGSPRSQVALASILTRIYGALVADETSAPRDPNGVLLADGFREQVPWSKERPRSVSDIPVFTPERVLAWQADAAVEGLRAEREEARKHPKKKQKQKDPTPPPGFAQATASATPISTQTPAPNPSTVATSAAGAEPGPTVNVQPQTDDEKAYDKDPGSGPVVQAGLQALRSRTLSALNRKKESAHQDAAQSNSTLLERSAQVWFISNRLYLLDRTGHVQQREEAWIDISAVRGLKAGGTYFFQPVEERVGGRTINFRFWSVSGGGGEPVLAEIDFPSVLNSFIPMLEINRQMAKQHAGVGLIIAPTFAQKRLTVSDISMNKVGQAIKRVPGKLGWAIMSELRRIKRDPLSEVGSQAMGLGISYLAKLIPGVGQAIMAYQLLEFAGWLGDAGNVAAYAQTEDEIDIAAQAIARKLAAFVVFEAISRGAKAGVKVVSGGGGPKTAGPETSADETSRAGGQKSEVPPETAKTPQTTDAQGNSPTGPTETAKPHETAAPEPKDNEAPTASTRNNAGDAANAGEGAKVIDLAAERQKRAAATKPVVKQKKVAAGAENDPTVASYGDDEIHEHIAEETQPKNPGDQMNPGDVGPENVRDRPHIRTGEYDPWSGDSKLLGDRLGKSPGPGYQAHHIVPAGEPRASRLRDFLRGRGWKDINDRDNGVWLPTGSKTGNLGGEYKHEFTFDAEHLEGEYFDRLESILMKDPKITPSGIRLKLRMIRGFLLKGQLPPKGM
jgi:Domain of unknown function (DUF4157)/A nuclease family of the HNH/ENDO VII superfamily with conserved AHH